MNYCNNNDLKVITINKEHMALRVERLSKRKKKRKTRRTHQFANHIFPNKV